MTGCTITKTQEFDMFFSENYNYLLGFGKLINSKQDYESLLHDTYLKCRKRIDLSGFTGSTFLNFVRMSMSNLKTDNYRKTKNYVIIDIEDTDFQDEIDSRLLKDADYLEQRKNYDNEMSYLNTMAFEYVDKYFTAKENMVFKTYFILKNKQLNYKQLAEATNYSITTVSNIIMKIKKELRENLITYINTGHK